MSTKVKSNPLNGAHTSGLFADMTLDGPEIGTLVAIVDRAKNLPNRKTIGKQDPYCAARLGKEAKKTTTDIRGGQTPKWDQELRFPVHDSPDYYQLKISVFTDDKKADLVGEAWIDLRAIVIPGGGQNDVWQTLTCKGKYAGEIRVEITFYDTRSKPEKPAPKPKPVASEQDHGSVKSRAPMKRRPLPSDPVTGEAPPAPVEHTPPPRAHAKQPSQTTHAPNPSPLQPIDYHTPPSHASRNHHTDHHSPSALPAPPQPYVTPTREPPRQSRRSMDPHEAMASRPYEERDYSPKYQGLPGHQEHVDPRERHYSPLPEPFEPPQEDPRFPPVDDDHPPPPPAHRTRHNSASQELVPRNAYDTSPTKNPVHMRHDVLRNEAHRHSVPAYPGRPTFRPYDSAPAAPKALPPAGMSYEPSPPRHHSYDPSCDPHHRSLQPTVEDAPEPVAHNPNTYRHSSRLSYSNNEVPFEQDPSPAPLNLSRSAGASPYREESPSQGYGYSEANYQMAAVSPSNRDLSHSPGQNAYHHMAISPSNRDLSHTPGQNAYHQMAMSPSNRDLSHSPGQSSYYPQNGHNQLPSPRAELEDTIIQSSTSYSLPALPPSLVPGIDPKLSQEISERIYEERRHDRYNSQVTPTRGRQSNEQYQSYQSGSSPGYGSFNERRAITYTTGPETQVVKPRAISPNTRTSPNPQQRLIRRKSVSPAPNPTEPRRLSGVPFGPDDYDALNPSASTTTDGKPPPDFVDESKKIITYDGREVDPSDHLPIESWAPEPESKPKDVSPEPRARPSPSGAQPMPPTSRRTPRTARPHSQSLSSSRQPYLALEGPQTPPAPPSTGRTRLQKRNRASAGPSPAASSPLAPISPDNYQDRQSPYTPTRGLPRASTWDHQNENRAPYAGPPIPAKIPLALMSGANGGGGELSLMEEMQRIDIGSGRSRRRGGH